MKRPLLTTSSVQTCSISKRGLQTAILWQWQRGKVYRNEGCACFSVREACSQHENLKPGEQKGRTENRVKFVKEVGKSLGRHKLKSQVLQKTWTPISFFFSLKFLSNSFLMIPPVLNPLFLALEIYSGTLYFTRVVSCKNDSGIHGIRNRDFVFNCLSTIWFLSLCLALIISDTQVNRELGREI